MKKANKEELDIVTKRAKWVLIILLVSVGYNYLR